MNDISIGSTSYRLDKNLYHAGIQLQHLQEKYMELQNYQAQRKSNGNRYRPYTELKSSTFESPSYSSNTNMNEHNVPSFQYHPSSAAMQSGQPSGFETHSTSNSSFSYRHSGSKERAYMSKLHINTQDKSSTFLYTDVMAHEKSMYQLGVQPHQLPTPIISPSTAHKMLKSPFESRSTFLDTAVSSRTEFDEIKQYPHYSSNNYNNLTTENDWSPSTFYGDLILPPITNSNNQQSYVDTNTGIPNYKTPNYDTLHGIQQPSNSISAQPPSSALSSFSMDTPCRSPKIILPPLNFDTASTFSRHDQDPPRSSFNNSRVSYQSVDHSNPNTTAMSSIHPQNVSKPTVDLVTHHHTSWQKSVSPRYKYTAMKQSIHTTLPGHAALRPYNSGNVATSSYQQRKSPESIPTRNYEPAGVSVSHPHNVDVTDTQAPHVTVSDILVEDGTLSRANEPVSIDASVSLLKSTKQLEKSNKGCDDDATHNTKISPTVNNTINSTAFTLDSWRNASGIKDSLLVDTPHIDLYHQDMHEALKMAPETLALWHVLMKREKAGRKRKDEINNMFENQEQDDFQHDTKSLQGLGDGKEGIQDSKDHAKNISQRRRLQNRNSSRRFRIRQTAKVGYLELRIGELEKSKEELERAVNTLEQEQELWRSHELALAERISSLKQQKSLLLE